MASNLSDLRLAVLIDADNAPRKNLKNVMAEIALYGTPTVKRIYGDWTSPNLTGWKTLLLENAITPVQQYGYTTGKNSTDSAMIIDAMDILYSGKTDGFCLVSSDSDFTRLATRLREAGMKVIGIGEKKTPNSFIVACDKFIYTEIIGASSSEEEKSAQASKNGWKLKMPETKKKPEEPPAEPSNGKVTDEVAKLIATTVSDLADEDGWAFMGEIGNLLLKKQPDFDPRNFGFQKLTPLIKSLSRFEIDVRQTNIPYIKHIYVRDKSGAESGGESPHA